MTYESDQVSQVAALPYSLFVETLYSAQGRGSLNCTSVILNDISVSPHSPLVSPPIPQVSMNSAEVSLNNA